jgi:hypothetical protein
VAWFPAYAEVTPVARRSLPANVIPAQAGTQCTDQQGIPILRLCPSKPCVYILARKRNGTIDIGVTGGFLDRAALHTQDVDEFRGRDPRGAG